MYHLFQVWGLVEQRARKLLKILSVRSLLLVNLFPHLFTWTKAYHLSFFNGDGFTSAWITASAWLLVADIKSTKMDKFNGFTIKEPILHSVQKSVYKFCAGVLGVSELSGEGLSQFFTCKITFIHINLL